MKPGY